MKTRARGRDVDPERFAEPRGQGRGRSTVRMAARQSEKIFDYYAQGFTIPQIATALGVTRLAIQLVIRKPEFKERFAQFQTQRREAIVNRLEASAETAAVSLLRTARGGETDPQTGKLVPIDPRIADVQIKASEAILDRAGFPRATRSTVSTTVTGAVRTGPNVSDEDMERLRALLGGADIHSDEEA